MPVSRQDTAAERWLHETSAQVDLIAGSHAGSPRKRIGCDNIFYKKAWFSLDKICRMMYG